MYLKFDFKFIAYKQFFQCIVRLSLIVTDTQLKRKYFTLKLVPMYNRLLSKIVTHDKEEVMKQIHDKLGI